MPDFLLEFLRIYKPTDYETDVRLLLLYAVVQLGTLGALVYYLGDQRNLRLSVSFCVKLLCIAVVALHYKNRAECTESEPCKVSGADVVKRERNAHNMTCAVTGMLLWFAMLGTFGSVILKHCSNATDFLRMLTGPINELFGGLAFTDARMEAMLWGHSPLMLVSAAVCAVLTQPQIMCILECFRNYTGCFIDIIFVAAIYTTYIAFCWILILLIDKCCCCTIQKTGKEFFNASGFLRDVRATLPILPPTATTTTGFKADKHNINTIGYIAEAKKPLTKYALPTIRRPQLLTHFTRYCTVDGKDATEEHIKAAFAKANILYENDGLRLWLIRELTNLGLV